MARLHFCLKYSIYCFRNAWLMYKSPIIFDMHISNELDKHQADKIFSRIVESFQQIWQEEYNG